MTTMNSAVFPVSTFKSLDGIMAEYLERVKQLEDDLVREMQANGSDALERSEGGRAFLHNLVSGCTISPVLRHVATECAAQDYWHYASSSTSHFRAVELAQREISRIVACAIEHHKVVAKLKRERDVALAATKEQAA